MSTDFNTITDDLKTSFRLAWKNALSYFLANLGLIVVMVLIIAVAAVPVTLVALAAYNYGFTWPSMGAIATWTIANPWALLAIGFLVVAPLIGLIQIVTGSTYGMSKEVVDTGDTNAETAFSYLRHKFLAFAAAGVVYTAIVLLPPATVVVAVTGYLNYQFVGLTAQLLSIFIFVWVFTTSGLTSMVLPAIVSGKGVQDAFKESFRLATQRFERVFGVYTAIFLLAVGSFAPIIIWAMSALVAFPPFVVLLPQLAVVATWTLIAAFLWLLLLIPMARIAYVKVYTELNGGQVAVQAPPEIPMI
ncbi:MAG: hypothetical protein ACXADL_01155 [Candidatus Thorarchaeota archaeon]|jgi:hypothetical protein